MVSTHPQFLRILGDHHDSQILTEEEHIEPLILGKSWACKHWKFQNNYFVIFFAFLLHVFLHFCLSFWICVVICVVIFLSFLCHFFVIFCHLFVILLSFYCHFGNGKMEKTIVKK